MRYLVLLFFPIISFAGGIDIDNKNVNKTSSSSTTGNIDIGGDSSRAYGLSNSLGDVDIAQCIVTKQKGNVVWSWQNYDYNIDCLADRLDRSRKHVEAATLRCQAIPELINIKWPSGQSCIQAMTLRTILPPEPPEPPKEVTNNDEEDHHYARVEQLEQQIMEQQSQFTVLLERTQNNKTSEPKPFLTERKRKALQELKSK